MKTAPWGRGAVSGHTAAILLAASGMAKLGGVRFYARRVSGASAACLFFAFSMVDLLLSSAAFALGAREANPVLAWLALHDLLVPGKIILSLLAAAMIATTYWRPQARRAAWFGVFAMLAVNFYHIWGLSLLVS